MPKRKSCCGLPWYLIYNSFDSSKYRHNDPHQLYKVYPLYDFISHNTIVCQKNVYVILISVYLFLDTATSIKQF
jgi:hypothetical protein